MSEKFQVNLPKKKRMAGIENPILTREIRTRLRGLRFMIIITAFLVIAGLAVWLTLISQASNSTNINPSAIGKQTFTLLSFAMLILVCMFAPAFTVGAFAQEHQQRTFDMLQVTLLKPWSMIMGKWAASLMMVLLLLISLIPLLGLCFLFGGVTLMELIEVSIIAIMTAVFFSSIGLLGSSICRRMPASIGFSYLIVFLICVFNFLIYIIAEGVFNIHEEDNLALLANAVNPFFMMIGVLDQLPKLNNPLFAWTQLPQWLHCLITFGLLTIIITMLHSAFFRKLHNPRRS
jgi:ABC-2 type transport system permease protein